MVWKQDLAKLKQQLGEAPKAPPPKPAPKPAEKPAGPLDLDTEDAVFLAAMGRPAPRPAPRPASAGAPAPEPTSPVPPPESFEAALTDLKGLKPLARPAVLEQPPAPAPAPTPALPPVPEAAAPAPPAVPEPQPKTAPLPEAPAAPIRFQLAAGMALEVDGVLDLRGHSRTDAVERIRDRLADGQLLGWRTLQVVLGPDPELHEGLLALLESGEVPMIARYAQAPVPMGGTQAWLLYFSPQA